MLPRLAPWAVLRRTKRHVPSKLWRAVKGDDDPSTPVNGDGAAGPRLKARGAPLPLDLAVENRAAARRGHLPDLLLPFQRGCLDVAFRLFEQNDDGIVGEDDLLLHYQSLGGLLLSPDEVDARAAKGCESLNFEGSVSSAQLPTQFQSSYLGRVIISPRGLVR